MAILLAAFAESCATPAPSSPAPPTEIPPAQIRPSGGERAVVETVADAEPASVEDSSDEQEDDAGPPQVADRDGDGTPEKIFRSFDGGSGFGWVKCRLEVEDGGSWTIESGGSFGTMAQVAVEPAGLPNEALRDALMECALGDFEADDESFDWWLEAAREHYSGATTWTIPHRWSTGQVTPPRVAARRFEVAEPWMQKLFVEDPPQDFGSEPVWIGYNGPAHLLRPQASMRELATRGKQRLVATNHGLAIQRGKQHAWIFVSDVAWGGPEKLRHRSVFEAGFLDDDTVWALQGLAGPDFLWLLSDGRQIAMPLTDLQWKDGSGRAVDWSAVGELAAPKVTLANGRVRIETGSFQGEVAAP